MLPCRPDHVRRRSLPQLDIPHRFPERGPDRERLKHTRRESPGQTNLARKDYRRPLQERLTGSSPVEAIAATAKSMANRFGRSTRPIDSKLRESESHRKTARCSTFFG